jgi:hypothetical protein
MPNWNQPCALVPRVGSAIHLARICPGFVCGSADAGLVLTFCGNGTPGRG